MIKQFPYFAPDLPFLKPAQKATDADKLYLWMYTNHKANMDLLNEDDRIRQKTERSNVKSEFDTQRDREPERPGEGKNWKKIVLKTNKLKADRTKNGDTLTQHVFGD